MLKICENRSTLSYCYVRMGVYFSPIESRLMGVWSLPCIPNHWYIQQQLRVVGSIPQRSQTSTLSTREANTMGVTSAHCQPKLSTKIHAISRKMIRFRSPPPLHLHQAFPEKLIVFVRVFFSAYGSFDQFSKQTADSIRLAISPRTTVSLIFLSNL